MPVATNQQVQNFVDQQVRPGVMQFMSLLTNLQAAVGMMPDIVANLTGTPTTTWSDNRTDGPPHLATPSDITTVGAAVTAYLAFINGTGTAADSQTMAAAMPIIRQLCMRS